MESVPHDAADHGEEPGEAVAPLGVAKFPAATQRRPMGYTVNKHKSHEAGKALGCSVDVGEVGSVVEEGSSPRSYSVTISSKDRALGMWPAPGWLVGSFHTGRRDPLASESPNFKVIRILPLDPGGVNAVVSATRIVDRDDELRTKRLHPLRHGHPRFIGTYFGHAEVSESRAAVRHKNTLRGASHREFFRVNLCDEQRRPVTNDMVIAGALAGVNEEQSITVRHPVLLSVVRSQLRSVVPRPDVRGVEVQAVSAGGDVTGFVVAQREEIPAAEASEGRLTETAPSFDRQRIPIFVCGQGSAVETTAQDPCVMVRVTLQFAVDRQQDVSVRQIDALHRAGP